MEIGKYKIHISLGTIAAGVVVLYQVAPAAYTSFDDYHVTKTREVMEPEILLIAATARTLELVVVQKSLSDLRREEFELEKSIRAHDDEYTRKRLKTVQTEIKRLEQKECTLNGDCNG